MFAILIIFLGGFIMGLLAGFIWAFSAFTTKQRLEKLYKQMKDLKKRIAKLNEKRLKAHEQLLKIDIEIDKILNALLNERT